MKEETSKFAVIYCLILLFIWMIAIINIFISRSGDEVPYLFRNGEIFSDFLYICLLSCQSGINRMIILLKRSRLLERSKFTIAEGIEKDINIIYIPENATHTHTHTYAYIFFFSAQWICSTSSILCIYIIRERERTRERERVEGGSERRFSQFAYFYCWLVIQSKASAYQFFSRHNFHTDFANILYTFTHF